MASRILGMGDVLTLIDKAKTAYEDDEAEEAASKLLEGQFTLDDFLEQMQKLKKMGPLQNLLGLMPGMPKEVRQAQIDDRQVARVEAIIRSMTTAERVEPNIIDASRRNRIALGSGTQATDVKALLDQFKQVSAMMKRFGGFGSKKAKAARKADKRKGKQGGGRTTPKGPVQMPGVDIEELAAKAPKTGLRLPGLN
jgi:signal recognition particle subunit SRP54